MDQIAAGEVVERPASVVKELVENALDAGAHRVRIEVREGGAALVGVTDDGQGMTPEDARLALERHATSKIRSSDDLACIGTFGFRGEALPAIASVSRLRLRTRARGAREGIELRLEAGKPVEARASGGPEGTRIEVTDLFHNVPARRKFLKKPATEWGHVADWLERAALALPEVHFDVRRDERPALSWPATPDPLDRVAAVLSERDAAGLVRVDAEAGALRLEGFTSRPDAHRSSAAGIYLFVNRRPVRDRLLRHALLDVYRDVLPRGRFPTALLFLDLPGEGVDVNVHPAKWEVRFHDPRAVHRLVTAGVREALARRSWLARTPAPDSGGGQILRERAPLPGALQPSAAPGSPGDWAFAGRTPSRESRSGATRTELFGPPIGDEPDRLRLAALPILGQLHATYLLLEATDGLLLVDQHAAHERVLYERLRAGWRAEGVARQALLVPSPVELAADRVAALGECLTELERLGFEVEVFGEQSVVVRAVPALLSGHDPVSLLRSLADELGDDAGPRAPEAADRIFASLACHSARRAGDRLDRREQQSLLEAVDGIPWSPTCPHGRPVAIPISRGEIERRFGRA